MQQLINILIKVMLIICIPNITGCEGGGSSSSSPSAAGKLNITGDESVAIGGSQEYTISLVGGNVVTDPVPVQVNVSGSSLTTTNTIAIPYISDSCINGLTTNVPSCSVYINGSNKGKFNIEAFATNYTKASKSLTVIKKWGTVGGVAGDILSGGGDYLVFNGNTIYMAPSDAHVVYFSTNGSPWSLVGGAAALKAGEGGPAIAVDKYHVCVVRGNPDTGIVRCSSIGSDGVWQAWQTLAPLSLKFSPNKMSLYQGKIYVSGVEAVNHGIFQTMMYSCKVDSCTKLLIP
jgi:hypothetical protein